MDLEESWKYEIGTGRSPVVASAVMLALFGGLTFWLYRTQNGAFLFLGVLTALLALLLLLSLYRLCFYKVKIGRNGFFYQTNHKNGTYYAYARLKKAWLSGGREQNGYRSRYCGIDTGTGSVLRIPYYHGDQRAISYLLSRVEKLAGREEKLQAAGRETYVIDGRAFGKTRMAAGGVLLAVVLVLETLGRRVTGMAWPVPYLGSFLVAAALVILAVNYRCFKVEIGPEGVYVRTLPWNGGYYAYSRISRCQEIEKVVRRRRGRHVTGRSYYYFFEFTDMDGSVRRFQFEKPLFSHEVDVLCQRIREAGK